MMEPQGIVRLRSCRSFSRAFWIPRHRSRLSTECERDSVCVCECCFECKPPREAWTENQRDRCYVCSGQLHEGRWLGPTKANSPSSIAPCWVWLSTWHATSSLTSLEIRNERLWTCGLIFRWKCGKKALFCDRCLSVVTAKNLCELSFYFPSKPIFYHFSIKFHQLSR